MTNTEINAQIEYIKTISCVTDTEKREALHLVNTLHHEMDAQSWQKINGMRKTTNMNAKKMNIALKALEARIGGELHYSNTTSSYAVYPKGLSWSARKLVKGWK